jgi:hypothetical protein
LYLRVFGFPFCILKPRFCDSQTSAEYPALDGRADFDPTDPGAGIRGGFWSGCASSSGGPGAEVVGLLSRWEIAKWA